MGFGIAMKKCGMRDSCEKGAGMRDQDPPPLVHSSDSIVNQPKFAGKKKE